MPTPLYLYLRNCVRFRKLPDLKHPSSFNDHMLRMLLDRRDQRRRVFADKLVVRGYIESRIGAGHLPEIYQQADDPEKIDFSALPDKFVFKASHGSGMNQIILDKSQLDVAALKKRARQWLKTDYSKLTHEWVYENQVPLLFAEELLETGPGRLAPDYKLHCFHGRTRFIQVVSERSVTHQMRRRHSFYNADWQRRDFSWGGVPQGADIEKPPAFADMMQLANLLSRDFDFLRVDMYLVGDRIVIGELTNFPEAGNRRIEPVAEDYWLGSHFGTDSP